MLDFFLNWKSFLIVLIILSGCIQLANETRTSSNLLKLEGQDCNANTECESQVCDFIKQDLGQCASRECSVGSHANGLNAVAFFCNEQNAWQEIKSIGETCRFDYECLQRTDKDCPTCTLTRSQYSCDQGTCVEDYLENDCSSEGFKKIISKQDADFSNDGSCIQTLAQRPVFTVCAPCGNGICDVDLESNCNCPEDCE